MSEETSEAVEERDTLCPGIVPGVDGGFHRLNHTIFACGDKYSAKRKIKLNISSSHPLWQEKILRRHRKLWTWFQRKNNL